MQNDTHPTLEAAIPWADSPEDARGVQSTDSPSERVALDGGHVDVDVIDQHVETTVTLGGRISLGIALTAAEAAKLGEALTSAARAAHSVQAAQIDLGGVETVVDLYRTAQATGFPADALLDGMDR